MYVLLLAEAFRATHTSWYIQSETFHTFLFYVYVYLSKAEYVTQSKFACIEQANHTQFLES